MKRSRINQIITETIQFLDDSQFYLPEWATWSIDDWHSHKGQCQEIFVRALGWDVTDNGGDFDSDGLVLFTIRNGVQNTSRSYCEKLIVMKPGQVCPYHHHIYKTEDIINRSKGGLTFRVYHDKNPESPVSLSIDGMEHEVKSNEEIILHSGQSLTLLPFYTHSFWPREHTVLIGEVSTVNDDTTDNVFRNNKVSRFPVVEEDEDILYPIVSDYQKLGLLMETRNGQGTA